MPRISPYFIVLTPEERTVFEARVRHRIVMWCAPGSCCSPPSYHIHFTPTYSSWIPSCGPPPQTPSSRRSRDYV